MWFVMFGMPSASHFSTMALDFTDNSFAISKTRFAKSDTPFSMPMPPRQPTSQHTRLPAASILVCIR